MRWQTLGTMAAALLVVAAFSGCVGGAVENTYRDADVHDGQRVTGGHQSQREIDVPAGTSSLRVAVNYDMSGGFQLALHNPSHREVQAINQGGVGSAKDDNWYRTSNPAPGTWSLSINAGGAGGFSVGVYLD